MKPFRLVGKVHEVTRHRNGVGGIGFYVVTFTGAAGSDVDGRQFIATVFDDSPGAVAVLSLDLHGYPEEESCWRGDQFEPGLRAAIEKHERPVFCSHSPGCTSPAAHEIWSGR